MPLCHGITQKGYECEYRAKPGSNYCLRHVRQDPHYDLKMEYGNKMLQEMMRPKPKPSVASSHIANAQKEIDEKRVYMDIDSHSECCICFEQNVERTKMTACGHDVCIECLNKLTSTQCPVCRRKLVLPFDQFGTIMSRILNNIRLKYSQ